MSPIKPSPAKRIAFTGVFASLALALSFLEHLLPLPVPVPGIKLGLANIAVLTVLYLYGFRTAVAVSFIRVVLAGLLFSGVTAMLYALSGAVLSLLLMGLLRRTGIFGVVGVSLGGAAAHVTGQLFAAWFLLGTHTVFFYLPLLLVASVLTGALNGFASGLLLKYLTRGRGTPPDSSGKGS